MRTVLFLINGFGVEKKESYTIYDPKNIPTFDMMMKSHIFSRLKTNVFNIYDGYRNMSLELDGLYNYTVYNREAALGKISNNDNVIKIENTLKERKSKLHLFCFIDTSDQVVDNLKVFLKAINVEHDKTIFIHPILTCRSYEEFPLILNVLSNINIELGEYAKIGMIIGLSKIINSAPITEVNFLLRNMISELCEKWTSFKQKLDVEYGMKHEPLSVTPFAVNSGFSIKEDDLCMIWNYDNVDLTNIIREIKKINYGAEKENKIEFYSLFPVKDGAESTLPHILEFEVSDKSLAANMKGLGFKTLVMTKEKDINGINYYLNGMDMIKNDDITYISSKDIEYNKESIVNIVNTYEQDFIILNYDVTWVSTVEELQETLKKIDDVLGALYENTKKKSYSIVVSSLFGMHKTLDCKTGEKCNVMYGNVPIILADGFITRKDYLINEGSISEIFKICYKCLNTKYRGESILDKKNWLVRLIYK